MNSGEGLTIIPPWGSSYVREKMLRWFVTLSLHDNEQLFASRYKLVLPSEEELRNELERERAQLLNIEERQDSGKPY